MTMTEKIYITSEYKDELNAYAKAYARERDEIRRKEIERGIMSSEEISRLSPLTANKSRAWEFACNMFCFRNNGHWYYFNYDLGEEGMGFVEAIERLLNRYNPDHNGGTTFTTFMERRIKGLSQDYWQKVEMERERNAPNIDVSVLGNDDDNLPNQETPASKTRHLSETSFDSLCTFGEFSKVLTEHGWILQKISGYSGKRERFCVYYTRDFVLRICPFFSNSIWYIEKEINPILVQPYILYIGIEKLVNEKHAKKYLEKKSHSPSGYQPILAKRLYQLYYQGKLIEEKYQKVETLNTYFSKTNLSKNFNEYRELLQEFFIEHL